MELQLRPHPQDNSVSDEVIRNVSTTPNATGKWVGLAGVTVTVVDVVTMCAASSYVGLFLLTLVVGHLAKFLSIQNQRHHLGKPSPALRMHCA